MSSDHARLRYIMLFYARHDDDDDDGNDDDVMMLLPVPTPMMCINEWTDMGLPRTYPPTTHACIIDTRRLSRMDRWMDG